MKKTIFIVGASYGVGKLWTEAFLKRGENVIATVRDIDSLKDLIVEFPENLLILQLDVTGRKECRTAILKAKSHFGVINILINNAGYGDFNIIEEIKEQEIRTQFETNVIGFIWITKAIIPIMIEQRSGHIIQLSGIFNVVSLPILEIYNASKLALEGLTESMAREVAGFGIKVTLLEPSNCETDLDVLYEIQSVFSLQYNSIQSSIGKKRNKENSGIRNTGSKTVVKSLYSKKLFINLFFGNIGIPLVKYAHKSTTDIAKCVDEYFKKNSPSTLIKVI